MFRLKVIQALHGDCIILEAGSQEVPSYLLIDGGPNNVYRDHLKEELVGIRNRGGQIDLAVLSHVDDDHVNGLLDLFHDLINQREEDRQETVTVYGLWHNSFSRQLSPKIERGLARELEAGRLPPGWMGVQGRSIRQGDELAASAQELQIPINHEFRKTHDRLIRAGDRRMPVRLANLELWVVGPTRDSLRALQEEWEAWLAKKEQAARDLDMSVPNLSSIILLVKAEGKTVLLTGDGRGDELVEGLEQSGLMEKDGSLHVDVFKLPHHGSARNVTPELFERIVADTYLICADGTNDNPDDQTLEWLVEAALKQKRSFTLVATTETESMKALAEKYKPEENSYRCVFIEPGQNSITL